jgi:hypothetical protein
MSKVTTAEDPNYRPALAFVLVEIRLCIWRVNTFIVAAKYDRLPPDWRKALMDFFRGAQFRWNEAGPNFTVS